MKPSILLLGLGLSLPTQADIFTLKDGTKLDAIIKEKNLDEYTLEVNVTSSIKETRTIKRTDIVSHEIASEAETDFAQVKGLAPAPPFLSADEYKERIARLNEFLSNHKVSRAGTKASKMLEELEAELAVVGKGGIKTEKGLVTAEKVTQNILEIDAQSYAKDFEKQVAARAYIPALRAYDRLENECFGTTAHRKALPLFEKLVETYTQAISRELDSFADKEEKREASLDNLSESDRLRVEALAVERAEKLAKIRAKEERDGITWPTVDVQNADSLEEILAMLEEEPERLEEVKKALDVLPETGELFQKTYLAAAANNQADLSPLAKQIEQAPLGQKYFDILLKLPGFAEEKDDQE